LTQLALKHLRQALWQLHSAVSRDDDRLFEITPWYVALRSGSDLWLDITEFERVFERVRRPASQHLGGEEAAAVDRAIALYRGDLLDGFDSDWCIVEREWFQSAYLSMLDRLMGYREITGEYEIGIDYGERILRVDRAREYTHRRLMCLHALLGNRTGALRQYVRCVAALNEELDVLPARSTVLLWEQVRAGVEIDR
jgi:DNA-binding SARP family transcriptional activator